MKAADMKTLGERALLLRLIAAGAILILLFWSVLAPPARAQALGGARAVAPLAPEPELPASDLLVRYEGPGLSFRWSLAPEAALEPALVRNMRSTALAEREKAMREADENVKNPPPGREPIPVEWSERWTAEAETDALLALSARQYSFTGGAHGNLALGGLIWDRAAARRLTFPELFADRKGALATLRPAFCKALDAERAKRRQGTPALQFQDCPDPAQFAILPVGQGAITAVKVAVPPYAAGPWSEGPYEILLDAAPLRPFLLPRYAAAFAKP
jgi:hypothetical protein